MIKNYERIRYEMKYPVSAGKASQTLRDFSPYLEVDPYGNNGQYVIYSVYFDTRKLTFYQEKIDGYAGRIKFRMRTYLGMPNEDMSKEPVWFLESKERVRHYIAKSRFRLTREQADMLLNGYLSPGMLSQILPPTHPLMLKYANVAHYGLLYPTVAVYYHRNAYIFKGARDVRITLDHNLIALPPAGCTADLPNVLPIHHHNQHLLELKGNGWMPREMVDIICKNNLVATSFSKYCACVDMFQNRLDRLVKA